MGVVAPRLVFLAFLGLTGSIIYNALYLQDLHGPAAITAAAPPARVIASTNARTAPVEVKKLPPVSTDLPTPLRQTGDEEGASELLRQGGAARALGAGIRRRSRRRQNE